MNVRLISFQVWFCVFSLTSAFGPSHCGKRALVQHSLCSNHPHKSLIAPGKHTVNGITSGNSEPVTLLKMSSSLGDENEKEELPPFPENTLVLGGDVTALFFYSFLDHFMNDFTSYTMKEASAESIFGLHATWIDALHTPASFLSQQMPVAISYAPALDFAGICSVLFATCWLISGYFNEAFSWKNTVFCDTRHAMIVAGKTWVYAAFAMITFALLSDAFGADLQSQVGGLTKADADYIFDSLAVVVSWRFMIAYILGRW